jgi:hypothetical protein
MTWLREKEVFRQQYAHARDAQADALFEEAFDIADDGSNDWMKREGKDGSLSWVENGESIQRSRLRVDLRKWAAGKLAPKKYGEKVTQEHTGADGGPIEVAKPLCPAEVATALAALLNENEKLCGLEPDPELSDSERLKRIIETGEPVTPALYAGISVSRGPDKKFPYRGEN